MKQLIRITCLICLTTLAVGCSSLSYGPLKVTSLGTDLAVDSASWVKTSPDGTSEALTVVGGKRNASESLHAAGNLSAAIIGAIIGTGTPVGPAIGAAGGASLAEAWQSLQDWTRKGETCLAPETSLAITPATPSVNPVNPVNPVPSAPAGIPADLSDDPACELVIKYQERKLDNSGQVTYLNRVLTSRPHEGARPVCVQYNDTESGETTVWKDQSNQDTKVDSLPTDRGINKIVVWYE